MFDEYGYEEEIWKRVDNYPNYMISNFGRVWSVKRNRVLNPYVNDDGYLIISLHQDGKRKDISVHRLVALHFIQRRVVANEVNHDDGDKTYNYVENLEWSTHSENMEHAFENGLSIRKAVRIIETGEEFSSLSACAKSIGSLATHVSNCLSGKRKKHKGYTFEYV